MVTPNRGLAKSKTFMTDLGSLLVGPHGLYGVRQVFATMIHHAGLHPGSIRPIPIPVILATELASLMPTPPFLHALSPCPSSA